MNLPSIKLNVFKRLEYFLILKKLDKQFDGQFSILKSRVWNKEKREFGKFEEEKQGEHSRSVYPTWEVEKKVLFWTYPFHKLLKHEIRDKHFEDILVTEREKEVSGGISSIFGNLEMRSFGDCSNGYKISEDGLAFGELLWFLCEPIEGDSKIEEDGNAKRYNYFQVYQTNYKLEISPYGYWIFQLQLLCYYLLLVYGIAFFSLEFIKIVGLLDNLQRSFDWILKIPSIIINLTILSPFIIFTLSLVAYFIYEKKIVDKKFSTVEEVAQSNKK